MKNLLAVALLGVTLVLQGCCCGKKKGGAQKQHHHKHKARADKKHGYGKNCSIKKDMCKKCKMSKGECACKDMKGMKNMHDTMKKEETKQRGFFS